MPLLELSDVEARYGPIVALHGVSLAVDEGQVVAVLGANGAGKTTTLRAISGTVRQDRADRVRRAGARPPRPGGGRPPRRRARPRGPRHVRRAHRLGEPAPRRLHAQPRRRPQGRPRADGRLLPLDRAAPRPAGGHALGRRAADARARARAHVAPAPAPARRALARARAARHARDLPHRARAERAGGALRARRRAEREPRARRRPARVRARGRPRRPRRAERGAPQPSLRPQDATSGTEPCSSSCNRS